MNILCLQQNISSIRNMYYTSDACNRKRDYKCRNKTLLYDSQITHKTLQTHKKHCICTQISV